MKTWAPSAQNIYFGRTVDGTLENEFSGNLTEVCPTGVFTDRTHSEHYTRKWDMQFAPSICHQCSSGCNTSPGERYGEVRRIENRYNGDVNHYFLCDRGRFGYGYVNRTDRPQQPTLRHDDQAPELLTVDSALDRTAARLRSSTRVIGIGSPRASLESNHLLREMVGAENFSTGIASRELECLELIQRLQREGHWHIPSMREIEDHDAVIVLGEDLIQSAARVALAVRQAANARGEDMAEANGIPAWNANAVNTLRQERTRPVFIASLTETRLDDIARDTWHGAPEDIARLGQAIAHALDASAPAIEGFDDATLALIETIAEALKGAERPLIISGTSLCSTSVLQAAANLARALSTMGKTPSVSLISGEANSTGLTMLGGHSLEWALEAMQGSEGRADAAVILENDLYQRLSHSAVQPALTSLETLVVIDHQRTPTLEHAHLALPAATFAEGDGTLVSHEGRAQRFFQVYDPSYYRPNDLTHESWRWLHALHTTMEGRGVDWTQIDDVTADCARVHPELSGIRDAAPSASFRIRGQKLARSPHRSSGRTAMRANLSVHEPRAPQDADSAFAFSMEGYSGYSEPRSQVAFAWAPGWNSPQAWNKFQDEVGGHLSAGDPGVRLFDQQRNEAARRDYFTDIPRAFEARDDCWYVVNLPQLFGGEEMSARAEPIQERMSETFVVLGQEDADRLGVVPGEAIYLQTSGHQLHLPVRISREMRAGLIGLPHLPGIPRGLAGECATVTVEVSA